MPTTNQTYAMKPIYRFVLGAMFVGIAGRAPATEPAAATSATSEVLTLERQIGQASLARDRSALEKLLSPNFVCLSPSGRVIRKAEMVDFWTAENAETTDEKFEIENPEVFVDGASAICIAVTIDSWTEKGISRSQRERVFDVWQKTKEGWRLVASTSAKIVSPK